MEKKTKLFEEVGKGMMTCVLGAGIAVGANRLGLEHESMAHVMPTLYMSNLYAGLKLGENGLSGLRPAIVGLATGTAAVIAGGVDPYAAGAIGVGTAATVETIFGK